MTRTVYRAWCALLILGITASFGVGALVAWPSLRPAQIVRCGTDPVPRGHVRLVGCDVEPRTASRDARGVWVELRAGAETVARVRTDEPAHREWVELRPSLDRAARDRYLRRHAQLARLPVALEGWIRPGAIRGDDPELSLDAPREPLAIGGALFGSTLLLVLFALVRFRRQSRPSQRDWARRRGLSAAEGAPEPF